METPRRPDDEFSEAISSATQLIQERKAAAAVASEKAKPRRKGGLLLPGIALLVVVAVGDWYVLTRPPDPLPVAEQEVDLSWFILGAVDVVESFRGEGGELPTATDLAEVLDEEVTYTVQGGNYVLEAESNGVKVEYRSEVPLEDWVSLRALESGGGRP
jgi:hypothetical protein